MHRRRFLGLIAGATAAPALPAPVQAAAVPAPVPLVLDMNDYAVRFLMPAMAQLAGLIDRDAARMIREGHI